MARSDELSMQLITYFKDYSQYHGNTRNRLTHSIGVPGVLFSILGLLSSIVLIRSIDPMGILQLDLGLILWASVSFWYFTLNAKLALPMSFITLGMYFISRYLSVPIHIGIFVLAWIAQFIGHKIEGKPPAFFKSIVHLLIGPFYFFSKLVRAI